MAVIDEIINSGNKRSCDFLKNCVQVFDFSGMLTTDTQEFYCLFL